jgi:hypothetical protein
METVSDLSERAMTLLIDMVKIPSQKIVPISPITTTILVMNIPTPRHQPQIGHQHHLIMSLMTVISSFPRR